MDPPLHCPNEIYALMTDCWHAPEHRPTAEELFHQLDELKVLVVSAPDGQYYGQIVQYEEAGTVEGPSLEEIHEMISEKELEIATKCVHDKEASESITFPSSEEYRQLQDDNNTLKTESLKFKNEIEDLRSSIQDVIDRKNLHHGEQINQIELLLTISTHEDTEC